MTPFLIACALIIGAGVIATIAAVILRPGVFDRVVGVGAVGTHTTVLLAITGALYGRLDAFVDITLTYALLNFIATLAVAKYFTRRLGET